MFNLVSRPSYIEPVYNKIEFSFSYDEYAIGDLFYLNVLTKDENGTLNILVELTKNGDGVGNVTFDISSALQTLFTEVPTLNPNVLVQKDETAFKAYQVEAGVKVLTNGVFVRTEMYRTDDLYALRAAFPVDGSDSLTQYKINGNNQAKFLTAITPYQSIGQALYLPVLIPDDYEYFISSQFDSETLTHNAILTRGVWVINANPALRGHPNDKTVSVWLEVEEPTYTSTQDYTVECPDGTSGNAYTATSTIHSTYTQAEADVQALVSAESIANTYVVCELPD